MPKTNVRVSFLDTEGCSVPGPIFEVHSERTLVEITQVQMWFGVAAPRVEEDFYEDIREEHEDNADDE